MKFHFRCHTCVHAGRDVSYEDIAMEVRDDGMYQFKCPLGHTSWSQLQQERFELLFQIGVGALEDGYYREAVSSFTASLERFYEFSIRVYLLRTLELAGQDMTQDRFDGAWKLVANQSERQYGAFLFMHTSLCGTAPKLQTDKERSYRNSVIHKGHYSTRDEAVTYGESVRLLLREGIVNLQSRFPDELERATRWSMSEVRRKAPDGINVGLMFVPTVISLLDKAPLPGQSLADIMATGEGWEP